MKKIGIVVPTLLKRESYLLECLESIGKSVEAHILIMGPNVQKLPQHIRKMVHQVFEEPQTGSLADKINRAIQELPPEIEFCTWIGDDDLLQDSALSYALSVFELDPDLVLVFGACDYIDNQGGLIGTNPSGQWALNVSKIGPFLAPQPGSVFRRSAFDAVGGLDPSFDYAFDFDLFLSLEKIGKVTHLKTKLAAFRWHEESLSVRGRRNSVREASKVRLKHAKNLLKPIVFFLNPAVALASWFAGYLVDTRRSRKKAGRSNT